LKALKRTKIFEDERVAGLKTFRQHDMAGRLMLAPVCTTPTYP
jgi:hypothetical protein